MDNKREVLLTRALAKYGAKGEAKKQQIINVLKNTYDIDLVEYTDDMLFDLLNDVVYDLTENNLFTKYLVPPFSVLDTRQDYWLQRRKQWLKVTGNLTATKEKVLGDTMLATINGGSSNFDPVLAEVIMRWFNVPNGKILDPFGGEQTKGVVAGVLGLPYYGCEIRPDQVELNRKICAAYPNTKYVCGDSNLINQLIPESNFDLVFTSPPYYDLEVYSASDLSALPTYEEFMAQMGNIYGHCAGMLGQDRFFVVKVGEIRDKQTGIYRNFVGDTVKVLTGLGLKYYNEIILLNSVGTASMRASQAFLNRKVVKLHQNLLVFYKGDLKNIQANFKKLGDLALFKEQEQRGLF